MKTIAIKNGNVELVEKPDPKAKGEWVVVKILSSPMCTEYKGYKSGRSSDNLGHEAAGEVVDVDQSSLVKIGDKVAVMPQSGCNVCDLCLTGDYIHCQNAPKPDQIGIYEHGTGTYAQYIIKQDWLLVPIPDEISFDYGSMACCGLGPTYGAMQRMNVRAGETILITGMGPVGLGGIVNGMHRNARVITAELDPYRRELASNLGAVLSVNPTEKSSREIELTSQIDLLKAAMLKTNSENFPNFEKPIENLQDLNEEINPFESRLKWTIDLNKENFVGKKSLLSHQNNINKIRVAFQSVNEGIPRHNHSITCENKTIGLVTSGSYSPLLSKGIGMGYIDYNYKDISKLTFVNRGVEKELSLIKLPFYDTSLYGHNRIK